MNNLNNTISTLPSLPSRETYRYKLREWYGRVISDEFKGQVAQTVDSGKKWIGGKSSEARSYISHLKWQQFDPRQLDFGKIKTNITSSLVSMSTEKKIGIVALLVGIIVYRLVNRKKTSIVTQQVESGHSKNGDPKTGTSGNSGVTRPKPKATEVPNPTSPLPAQNPTSQPPAQNLNDNTNPVLTNHQPEQHSEQNPQANGDLSSNVNENAASSSGNSGADNAVQTTQTLTESHDAQQLGQTAPLNISRRVRRADRLPGADHVKHNPTKRTFYSLKDIEKK